MKQGLTSANKTEIKNETRVEALVSIEQKPTISVTAIVGLTTLQRLPEIIYPYPFLPFSLSFISFLLPLPISTVSVWDDGHYLGRQWQQWARWPSGSHFSLSLPFPPSLFASLSFSLSPSSLCQFRLGTVQYNLVPNHTISQPAWGQVPSNLGLTTL